jgi:hypothetical protein
MLRAMALTSRSLRVLAVLAGPPAVVLLAALPPAAGQGPPGPRGAGAPQAPFVLDPAMLNAERELVDQFDADDNDRLDAEERAAARAWMASQPPAGLAALAQRFGGPGGPGGPGGRGRGGPFDGRGLAPSSPGRRLAPADVTAYGDEPLYDPAVLRTLFLEFESDDWEQELADFYRTDVEVPATVAVDGVTYPDVGVHFRGMSSFMMVPAGSKRSLNLSFDEFDEDQRLLGYRTMNLLNAASDPTFTRAMLYGEIARSYGPAPKTNYVRVVINGESWGIYVNAQQFNSDFERDWFQTGRGERWTVPGSPIGQGGLRYLGDDVDAYRPIYDIRTGRNDEDAWGDFIELTRVLSETPLAGLEAALEPILDVDGVLRFLAVEVALVNTDGYWVRASDYDIYQDPDGRFHVIPHDMNEGMLDEGGPGRGRGGPGGGRGFELPEGIQLPPGFDPAAMAAMFMAGGVELDPLVGLDDPNRPLRSRLLNVPALRARYLGYVREVAERWLDWEGTLAPLVSQYQELIREDVLADTRKLYPSAAFDEGVEELRTFVEQRRAFLLEATRPGG